MPRETKRDRQLRDAKKSLQQAAASLRARTGREIAAGQVDDTVTVPPHSRYAVASLLEALAHDVGAGRVSEWSQDESVRLAREILAEDRE